jgi:hypothetical protein
MNADLALAETRAWLERAVIGLNLCPFAKAPHVKGQVRFVVSQAAEPEALLACLIDELNLLASMPPSRVETTLLIHPHVLGDFVDYNDFLSAAEAVVAALGLDGVIQLASFHPHYQFAESTTEDIGNATNRSPYPTLHLLREASIDRAVEAIADPATIFEANIETMRRLGTDGWATLRRQCRADAEADAKSPHMSPPGRP